MDWVEIPTLETERLRLRPLRRSDLDDYAAMYADPEVLRHLGAGPDPWDRGRAWRHLAFAMGHWQLGSCGNWAIEHRETRAFLGVVGFSAPEGWPGFELAGILTPRNWGKGYATESALAALSCCFLDWQKDSVISLIHPNNHASIRAAERIGETLQGRIQHLGREMLCYGIDRESYMRQHGLTQRLAS
jgi:RimJ/RimL family protein N-acetyltransferase